MTGRRANQTDRLLRSSVRKCASSISVGIRGLYARGGKLTGLQISTIIHRPPETSQAAVPYTESEDQGYWGQAGDTVSAGNKYVIDGRPGQGLGVGELVVSGL